MQSVIEEDLSIDSDYSSDSLEKTDGNLKSRLLIVDDDSVNRDRPQGHVTKQWL